MSFIQSITQHLCTVGWGATRFAFFFRASNSVRGFFFCFVFGTRAHARACNPFELCTIALERRRIISGIIGEPPNHCKMKAYFTMSGIRARSAALNNVSFARAASTCAPSSGSSSSHCQCEIEFKSGGLGNKVLISSSQTL